MRLKFHIDQGEKRREVGRNLLEENEKVLKVPSPRDYLGNCIHNHFVAEMRRQTLSVL